MVKSGSEEPSTLVLRDSRPIEMPSLRGDTSYNSHVCPVPLGVRRWFLLVSSWADAEQGDEEDAYFHVLVSLRR